MYPMTPTMVGATPTYPTTHSNMRAMTSSNPAMMSQQPQHSSLSQHHMSRPRSNGNSQGMLFSHYYLLFSKLKLKQCFCSLLLSLQFNILYISLVSDLSLLSAKGALIQIK